MGSALAIDPCTNDPITRRRPFGVMYRGPDVAHAGVDCEHGVLCSDLVQHLGGVFGVDRQVFVHVVGLGLDEVLERRGVLVQHAVEERAVAFLLYERQHRAQRGADVALDRQLERRAASQPRRVAINPHGARTLRAGHGQARDARGRGGRLADRQRELRLRKSVGIEGVRIEQPSDVRQGLSEALAL